MNLRIRIEDGSSPVLAAKMRALSGSKLTDLHLAAGTEVQKLTRDYFRQLESSYARAAQKQGAPHSGYFAEAAEAVAGDKALGADASGATLTITHPGFIRAFRNVKIVPRTAKSLAIPIHARSYGNRAAELWDRLDLFIPKGKRIIAAMIGGVLTPLYILCKSVTQKQDRSLLPSDEQFRKAAVAGAKDYLGAVRAQR